MKKLLAAGTVAALALAAAPALATNPPAPVPSFNNSGIWIQANTTITKTSIIRSSQLNATRQSSFAASGLVALSGNANSNLQASEIIVVQLPPGP